MSILHAYSHLATHWHRLNTPPAVLRSLPREKLAYFREVWQADFSSIEREEAEEGGGTIGNNLERFMGKEGLDGVVDTSHNPVGRDERAVPKPKL